MQIANWKQAEVCVPRRKILMFHTEVKQAEENLKRQGIVAKKVKNIEVAASMLSFEIYRFLLSASKSLITPCKVLKDSNRALF